MAKKNFTFLAASAKKLIIEKTNPLLPIIRQAELLALSRASVYYVPRVDPEEWERLRALDKVYTKYPFYGSRRLKFALADDYQIFICREQVQRLMHTLGIQAIYPQHQTTLPAPGHKIYPYLLKNLPIIRPNYVLAWELSETMETEFCVRALKSALAKATAGIHNSDQGAQFTSLAYTGLLETNNVQISMDGRGRCLDNIFTERLWRTVKYEDIYLKHYRTIEETYGGLQKYFPFKRRHQSLGYKTPREIYLG